jgi:hypothetical protein
MVLFLLCDCEHARASAEHARASEEHASTTLLWYRERGARERFAIIRVIAARAIHLVLGSV